MNPHSKNNHPDAKISDKVKVTVTINGTTYQIPWNKQMPLLSAMLHAGIDAPYSCGSGRCGSCTCKLEKGEVRLMRNSVLSETHIQQGLILACVAMPISTRIKINYDEF
ncbi:2Fe-2S iron-sulfur cluster binding domain-containing protein [Sphingobacterium sp.]|uniref:2Fe-2S iron-sulfur cluster-binding protein n=1 Tax=Sphingobacterium sp. TaxID=341027 RepID=UPI0028AB8C39|nr:2Fe-2S iron-sulfur cluster binding domain-containing protein [Sphingobacterium sp.]